MAKPEKSIWRTSVTANKTATEDKAAKLRALRLADEATKRDSGAWGEYAVREVTHRSTGAVFVHWWKGKAGPKFVKPPRPPGLLATEHQAYAAWLSGAPAEQFSQRTIAWNLSKAEAERIKAERLAAHAEAGATVINAAAAPGTAAPETAAAEG